MSNLSETTHKVSGHAHFSMILSLVQDIESNLAFDINIPELARAFNLSPWHFQRLFKSIVGDSLGGYIRGRRLTIAAEKLLDSKQSILNIAVDVGFSSHESFTRSFKSYFKLSPKEFRAHRPKVLLNEKPVLTPELFEHIAEGVDLNPEILTLPAINIVGLETQVDSPFTTQEPICDMVGETWFELLNRKKEIEFTSEDSLYALTISESGLFTEDVLRYIAGVPVTHFDKLPEGMTSFTLPPSKVAIFDTKTNVDEEMAKRTIDVIYGYWLAHQPYQRGSGSDYERFVNLRNPLKGDFDSQYVVPII